jgi:hypothetical protein
MASVALVSPDFPPAVQDWIRQGLSVRHDGDAPLAGRCGASIRGRNLETFCKHGAGWGTDHKGIGRCVKHEGQEAGLGLWIGHLTAEQYRRAMNDRDPGSRRDQQTGRMLPEHNAHELHGLSIEEVFKRYLDPEEAYIFDHIPTDPKRRIDLLIKMRKVALMRINKQIQAIRMQYAAIGQHPPHDKIAGYEGLADRISQTLARLEETALKHRALDSHNEQRSGLLNLLQQLTPEEVRTLENDPAVAELYRDPVPAALIT